MAFTHNVFIIGPMGAGKSSMGLQISKRLKASYFDSDRELEKRSGVDIEWMFEVEGEAGFRKREARIIDELTQLKGIVLSTGGGTIVLEENRQHLIERGIIVYLKVPFEEQLNRVNRIPARRPQLNVPNKAERLKELNDERETLYEKIADITFINDTHNTQQLAEKVTRSIQDFINNKT